MVEEKSRVPLAPLLIRRVPTISGGRGPPTRLLVRRERATEDTIIDGRKGGVINAVRTARFNILFSRPATQDTPGYFVAQRTETSTRLGSDTLITQIVGIITLDPTSADPGRQRYIGGVIRSWYRGGPQISPAPGASAVPASGGLLSRIFGRV